MQRVSDDMILMIVNYDYFTFNIVQFLTELGLMFEVLRNDQVTIPEIERMNPSGIVISPGPCTQIELEFRFL